MSSRIAYVHLGVADLARSRAFYQSVLQTLGIEMTTDEDKVVTFGGRFTLYQTPEPTENAVIAFSANNADAVSAFYRAGIDGGYREVNQPDIRQDRFTAALYDPDDNVIEAVHRYPSD